MKLPFLSLLLLSFYFSFCQSATPDTIIKAVTISFNSDPSIFPSTWRDEPINAQAEPLQPAEAIRCKRVVTAALNKYPSLLLKKELEAVYFLTAIKFYDVGYGGTNSSTALYLTNDGVERGYTDHYLEQTFHHEFSSILYRNHPELLDAADWIDANMEGTEYNDPEDGVGAIRNNESSQEFDTSLCVKGFLTQYSRSGMENDINTFAQNLFSPNNGFWDLVSRYPRIYKKATILISFYHSLNPLFTEAYFRKMAT